MPSIDRLRLYGGIPSGANVMIIEDRDGKPIGEIWPGVAKGTYSSRHFVSGRYFYGNTWEKALAEVEENDKIARTFQLAIHERDGTNEPSKHGDGRCGETPPTRETPKATTPMMSKRLSPVRLTSE